MRSTVIFRDRQELQAADFSDLQAYARASIDDLVRDAIMDGKGFAGFEVTQSTSSEVVAAPGRLYAGGAMYFRDTPTALSLQAHIPLITKRKVAIVVWGVDAELDAQARDFLVDVQTGETEPQVVAMHSARTVQMQVVAGIEAPDPQPPAGLDVSVLTVAYVTLSTSGIIAIEPAVGARLPSTKRNADAIAALQAWQEAVDPRVATIASEIADLKRSRHAVADQRDILLLAADMARLKEVVGLPDDYADYGADRFLDSDETDNPNLELLAKIEEGVRFGAEAATETQLSVFNPLDPNIKLSGGLVLPAWDHARRIGVYDYVAEASLAQYGYQTVEMRQLTMRRERLRYGTEFTVCTNSAWFRSGQYDPVTRILRRAGETFDVVDQPDTFGGRAHLVRVRQYWRDWVDDPYWTSVTINHSITGANVAQSFLNAQDGWMTRVWLWFTRLAGAGAVTIAICELTASGTPDPDRVVAMVTAPYESLRIGWTAIDVPPTFLRAGQHYAFRVVTNADHWVGLASGNKYAQGTFFYSTDGVFYAGDLTRDLMFAVDFAAFRSPRVETQLSPLSLSGGIAAIDLLAPMITTAIAAVVFEVQIAGRWTALSAVTPNLLIGLPPLLPFRAVFIGTTDVHAGLQTSGSTVRVSRPRTTFKHISTARLLPAATQTVHVMLRLENWSAAHHTVTCKLDTPGGLETADAVETRDLGIDPATGQPVIERTYVFDIATGVSTYQIVVEGSTTTALDLFHVAERVDIAF